MHHHFLISSESVVTFAFFSLSLSLLPQQTRILNTCVTMQIPTDRDPGQTHHYKIVGREEKRGSINERTTVVGSQTAHLTHLHPLLLSCVSHVHSSETNKEVLSLYPAVTFSFHSMTTNTTTSPTIPFHTTSAGYTQNFFFFFINSPHPRH